MIMSSARISGALVRLLSNHASKIARYCAAVPVLNARSLRTSQLVNAAKGSQIVAWYACGSWNSMKLELAQYRGVAASGYFGHKWNVETFSTSAAYSFFSIRSKERELYELKIVSNKLEHKHKVAELEHEVAELVHKIKMQEMEHYYQLKELNTKYLNAAHKLHIRGTMDELEKKWKEIIIKYNLTKLPPGKINREELWTHFMNESYFTALLTNVRGDDGEPLLNENSQTYKDLPKIVSKIYTRMSSEIYTRCCTGTFVSIYAGLSCRDENIVEVICRLLPVNFEVYRGGKLQQPTRYHSIVDQDLQRICREL